MTFFHFFFPDKRVWHFMQIANLHEISIAIFSGKNEKYFKMSSTEIFTSRLSIKLWWQWQVISLKFIDKIPSILTLSSSIKILETFCVTTHRKITLLLSRDFIYYIWYPNNWNLNCFIRILFYYLSKYAAYRALGAQSSCLIDMTQIAIHFKQTMEDKAYRNFLQHIFFIPLLEYCFMSSYWQIVY